jgi:hypothetical protein
MRRVLVNRAAVEQNDETGSSVPVFTIIDDVGNESYGMSVSFMGPTWLKYDRNKPFGTRVWIETFSTVNISNDTDIESVFVPMVEI